MNTELWSARLNPSSPRYLEWRRIFDTDEIPLSNPFPLKAKLGEEIDMIYMLDWNNMDDISAARLIDFVVAKFFEGFPVNWAYIAGFFDGEGSISQCTGKICWTIAIAQADRRVLEIIAHFLGSHGITTGMSTHHPKGIQRRTVYILYTRGRHNCRIFIKETLPFLHVKKVIMQDVLRFLNIYGNLGLYQRFLVKPPRPRGIASYNGKKICCPRGHEYSDENTWTSKRGSRACRTCNRLRARSARTEGGRLSSTQPARARL